jgi:hypothetical protein
LLRVFGCLEVAAGHGGVPAGLDQAGSQDDQHNGPFKPLPTRAGNQPDRELSYLFERPDVVRKQLAIQIC